MLISALCIALVILIKAGIGSIQLSLKTKKQLQLALGLELEKLIATSAVQCMEARQSQATPFLTPLQQQLVKDSYSELSDMDTSTVCGGFNVCDKARVIFSRTHEYEKDLIEVGSLNNLGDDNSMLAKCEPFVSAVRVIGEHPLELFDHKDILTSFRDTLQLSIGKKDFVYNAFVYTYS